MGKQTERMSLSNSLLNSVGKGDFSFLKAYIAQSIKVEHISPRVIPKTVPTQRETGSLFPLIKVPSSIIVTDIFMLCSSNEAIEGFNGCVTAKNHPL